MTSSEKLNWRTCSTHGDENPHVWGCPECLRELRDENKRLRGLLAEAADCVADWGAYADNYFQHKHDLASDVKRFREASLMAPNAELTGDGLRSSTASGAAPLLGTRGQETNEH